MVISSKILYYCSNLFVKPSGGVGDLEGFEDVIPNIVTCCGIF